MSVAVPSPAPVRRSTANPRAATRRRHGAGWTALGVIEVFAATGAVLADLFLPAVVLTALAAVSLLVRRERPTTLGFHRLRPPGHRLLQVAMLALGWTTMVFLLVMPIVERVTGSAQDTREFADLEGDLPRLLLFLALSWSLAAVVEETAFRGYLLTRITDLIGTSAVARALAVLAVAALFALIHGEQGSTGMVLVFVDAVFFGALRYAFGSLWAPVVAHGLSNTLGMTAFFLFGPFGAPW